MTFARAMIWTQWQPFTSVFSAEGGGADIGNGSVASYWRQTGWTIEATIRAVFGITSTFGSGAFNFTLPADIATSLLPGPLPLIGSGRIDTDTPSGKQANRQWLGPVARSSTTVAIRVNGTGSLAQAGVPVTWDDDYRIFLALHYPRVTA